MIVKGHARGVRGLASHLEDLVHGNELVEIVEMHGVYADTLDKALRIMGAGAENRNRAIYHGILRPQGQDDLSYAQAIRTADRMEHALGMQDHPRIIVCHIKPDADGKTTRHYHLCWQMMNPETLKPARDSWNYPKHLKVSKWAIKEFGLSPMPGKRKRPAMDHAEWQVSGRMKSLNKTQVRDFSLAALEVSRTVPAEQRIEALAGELAAQRLVLAKGNKLVKGLPTPIIVDPDGQLHALGRQVSLKVHQLDLGQMNGLPTIAQAKLLQEQNPELVQSVGEEWRASQQQMHGHVQAETHQLEAMLQQPQNSENLNNLEAVNRLRDLSPRRLWL